VSVPQNKERIFILNVSPKIGDMADHILYDAAAGKNIPSFVRKIFRE
jgi:hypothetical protein